MSNSDQATFFESFFLFNFSKLVRIVGAPGVVFWPSTSFADKLCIQRCSCAYLGCNKCNKLPTCLSVWQVFCAFLQELERRCGLFLTNNTDSTWALRAQFLGGSSSRDTFLDFGYSFVCSLALNNLAYAISSLMHSFTPLTVLTTQFVVSVTYFLVKNQPFSYCVHLPCSHCCVPRFVTLSYWFLTNSLNYSPLTSGIIFVQKTNTPWIFSVSDHSLYTLEMIVWEIPLNQQSLNPTQVVKTPMQSVEPSESVLCGS